MTSKLENHQYSSENDFRNDMELMFKNCFRYNIPGTIGYVMGIRFEKAFRKEWEHLVKRSKKF
jgi:bromodomain-containing factor 1